MKRSVVVAAVVAFVCWVPSALAFDTSPHFDITRDALQTEGFANDAVRLAQTNNWFVDLYENYEKLPNSGHSGALLRFLGTAVFTENWDLKVARAADRSHFDQTNGGFATTAALTAEWDRLRRTTAALALEARNTSDPKMLVAVLGISLHQVQDFYSHTNWLEPGGASGGTGPNWEGRGYGRTPTWFDIPKSVRDTADLYSAGSTGRPRDHGGWNADGNTSLSHSMAKDWPGRPLYTEAHMAAYFASRQWVQAIRGYVNDDAFWQRAMHVSGSSGLNHDQSGATNISLGSGHWLGQGEPCDPSLSWGGLSCGSRNGPGGNLLDLRGATKSFFAGGRTEDRRRWERLIVRVNNQTVTSGPMFEPASSQSMQHNTRFVELAIKRFAEVDNLDIPGRADFFARVSMANQRYLTGVINDRDTFAFVRPNKPFRFLKAVSPNAMFPAALKDIRVRIRTGGASGSGTNDTVYLRINDSKRFALDKRLYDDFERGDDDIYSVPIDDALWAGLTLADIKYLQIEKSSDGVGGAWKLAGAQIWVNGAVALPFTAIGQWLQGSRRTWRTAFTLPAPQSQRLSMQIKLYEMDAPLRGNNDLVDIHPWDRRTSVVRTYQLGAPIIGLRERGASAYSGRLGDADRGSIDWTLRTIDPRPGILLDPPETRMPDLIVTNYQLGTVTIKNQGKVAAGAFTVQSSDGPLQTFTGLAAGQSATRTWTPSGCVEGHYEARADAANTVQEYDEVNNTAGFDVIC